MQISDTPVKIPQPFAYGAAGPYITTIPVASQIGITDGAASFIDGFPPLTFVSIDSGGAAPFGQDYNGLFYQITAGLRWQQGGGPIGYDATYSAAVGGYANGAIIRAAASATKFWLSTADNNTSNPDSGGANWTALAFPLFPFAPTGDLLGGNGTAFTTVGVGAGLLLSGGALSLRPLTLLYWSVLQVVDTFTVPANVYRLFGRCTGGGGGGASSKATASGGAGGAGAHCYGWFDVTPGQVITITTGAPGVGGVAAAGTGGADGSAGTASSIGAYLSANAGSGGEVQATLAGGATIQPTYSGGNGFNGGEGSDGSPSLTACGGHGGASFYGGGGRASTIGNVGFYAPGSGGGGGYGTDGIGGGQGAHGIVEIWG